MDLRQLRYFYTIAEEGQITSAAKKLNMAQPPLSQQLKQLEEELGVQLVERGSRHIKLTYAGEILRNRARQILELSSSTVKEINDFSKGFIGTIAIGTVSSSGAVLLNDKIASFIRDNSGVKLEIHEGNTFMIIDLLNKGIIEVGIVRTPFNGFNFECNYARSEPMVAAVPISFGWDVNETKVQVSRLKDMPLIIYRRFEQLIYRTCNDEGFEPYVFCKNDDARTSLMWANAGFGIALIPKSAFELGVNSNLMMVELDNEKLYTQIAAIWVKDRYISPISLKFLESFKDD